MAEASLALAERRAGDLKVAAEKLGQTPPSNRQLFVLQLMGYIVPPPGSSIARRVGGVLLLIAIIVGLLAIGWGIVMLVSLPFGGLGSGVSVFWGFLLVAVSIAVFAVYGRRRQKRARTKAAAQRADQLTGKRSG
jgi:uncharacterized membrane protein